MIRLEGRVRGKSDQGPGLTRSSSDLVKRSWRWKPGGQEALSYWNEVAHTGPLVAVIDPDDRPGLKSLFIDTLQKSVLSEVMDLEGVRLLDFGCGSGRLFPMTVGKASYVVGLEISRSLLEYARPLTVDGGCGLALFDGRNMPFRNGAFDAALTVGCIQTLTDAEHFDAIVGQLVSSVRKGGKIYVLEQVRAREDAYQLTASEYRAAFARHGCSCIDSYPVRNSRSVLLYAIRYGLVPRAWLPFLARREIVRARNRRPAPWVAYQDQLFVFSRNT